jgi:hypothetical protein
MTKKNTTINNNQTDGAQNNSVNQPIADNNVAAGNQPTNIAPGDVANHNQEYGVRTPDMTITGFISNDTNVSLASISFQGRTGNSARPATVYTVGSTTFIGFGDSDSEPELSGQSDNQNDA